MTNAPACEPMPVIHFPSADVSHPEAAPKPALSEAKLRANRENAKLSTGPKTPEGKRRSSLNAYRSGLHGQIVCATAEELACYQKHVADVLAEYEPSGPTETFLAVSVADNMWRLERARGIENNVFAEGFRDRVESIESGHPEVDAALAGARTWEHQSQHLYRLSGYEIRIHRILEKDTARLEALQESRKLQRQEALEQATVLVQEAEARGETYQPGGDFEPVRHHGGFVFSREAIRAAQDRKNRLQRPQNCDSNLRNRKPSALAASNSGFTADAPGH